MAELVVKNPYTGEVDRRYDVSTWHQANESVDSALTAQKSWQQLDLTQRISLVHRAMQYFDKNRDVIAKDLSLQMGRPFHQAKGELNGFFERAEYLCKIAAGALSSDELPGSDGIIRRIEHIPHGVIFIISAWNFPLLITVNSVIPALIAGNTVLLKHSSLTPEIGRHFERAFRNIDNHKDLLQNVVVDHETTGKLIEKSNIQHVIFTGSVSGGRKIAQHCSRRFISPGLELGGKDAAYVHSSSDLSYAVESTVDGAMFNSGQSCCGIERALVDEKIYDRYLASAKNLIDDYVLGDPQEKNTSMGPLASGHSASLMLEQVEQAVAQGAKLLAGGKIKKIAGGVFFEPTLIADCTPDMDIMQEENFGPILAVMKVNTVDQAISVTNGTNYGLTAAVFANDTSVIDEFSRRAEVGTVFANRCDYLDPSLPWTGIKNSGSGSSLSKYGFYSVTRRKAYHLKSLSLQKEDS